MRKSIVVLLVLMSVWGWYFIVYAYDGAIVFKHPLYAVGDRIHIAVVSNQQALAMPMVLTEHPMSD